MNNAPTDDLRQTAAAFEKSAGPKMDTLLQHRIAVLELRHKGASFTIIARLLESIGVLVSTDTIRLLCARTPSTSFETRVVQIPTTGQAPKAINSNVPRGPRITDPSRQ
ncbi:MAG: hypothetical protein WCK17_15690 [Verrucomicrobiota bacterium]